MALLYLNNLFHHEFFRLRLITFKECMKLLDDILGIIFLNCVLDGMGKY